MIKSVGVCNVERICKCTHKFRVSRIYLIIIICCKNQKLQFAILILLLPIMDSTRQQKVSRLIQKDLSNIFQVEGRGMYANAMVTVTQVRVSPDLAVAKIYLSIFAAGSIDKKDILEKIKLHSNVIRKNLGIRIGKQVRVIPELEFFIDDSLDYIENIEELLKK